MRLGLHATVVVLGLSAGAAPAAADYTVQVCGPNYGNNVFTAASTDPAHFGMTASCPTTGNANTDGFLLYWAGQSHAGAIAHWQTVAPPGLELLGATANGIQPTGVNAGGDFGGGFYWQGGGPQVNTFTPTTLGMSFASPSPYFGFQIVCGKSVCNAGAAFQVKAFSLDVRETSGPNLVAPTGLWQASGWVRGTWPFVLWGNSPSGLCTLSASLNGQLINTTTAPTRDAASWVQCVAPPIDQPVDTGRFGQGAVPLTVSATDTAGVPASQTKTVYVDNTQPAVSLSGPTDAPTTAGTQYVTATTSAGPSGVSGIGCSVDGSPYAWHPEATLQLPVAGVGTHRVTCYSANNARDASGHNATSAPQTWTLGIRQPAISTVSFAHIADALRCSSRRERVHIPAQWVTGTYKGHHVKVKLPAQTRNIKVVHCHPRIVRRRVRIHGRWRAIRAVVLPHAVSLSTIHVRAGAAAVVSGWLGTTNGNAIGGQPVQVLTAPDNGAPQWTQVATATTAANGTWSALLPPGPSRLVMATFNGTSTVEPANSTAAHVVVRARVTLAVRPRNAHWGGRIMISGRVKGGYIPPAGELVVLWIGWPGGSTEIGHLYTRRDGRFASRYTFLRGNGTERYRLWAATARESDYPYAPGSSRRVAVTVAP